MRLRRYFCFVGVCWLLLVSLFCDADQIEASSSSAIRSVLDMIEWIGISDGEFIMGSTEEHIENFYQESKLRSSMLERPSFEAETPQHKVYLSAYQISQHEITNAQYRVFINQTKRPKPRGYKGEDIWANSILNADNQPVVGVTWFDAYAFANWIGGSLPTEAQWERAARGTDGLIYPWGNSPPTRKTANFARHLNRPSMVGQFPEGASAEGVDDLAGNVWEWCLDQYDPNFYQEISDPNPANFRHKNVLTDRVIRGGSWDYGRVFIRSSLRFKLYPLDSTNNIGFRIVRKINSEMDQ